MTKTKSGKLIRRTVIQIERPLADMDAFGETAEAVIDDELDLRNANHRIMAFKDIVSGVICDQGYDKAVLERLKSELEVAIQQSITELPFL